MLIILYEKLSVLVRYAEKVLFNVDVLQQNIIIITIHFTDVLVRSSDETILLWHINS